jgi:Family of unknown function (DUF5686)/CarboxypepD_reg-like domain
MRFSFITIFFFTFVSVSGQSYRLTGKITNNKLEPLAFVSVNIKELQQGAITKEDGTYELKLDEGKYDIVITMIGFKPQVLTITLSGQNAVLNTILEPDETKTLGEVFVRGKNKDRAEEYIRNVIRNKEAILSAPGAFSCNIYIKATQLDSSAVKKKKKEPVKTDTASQKLNTEMMRMAMAEISLKQDYESETKIKEERTGVKLRGNTLSLFYLSTTEGNFNFYNNLIKVRGISEITFLSPISYSGLVAYKYKIINIKQQGTRKIYTISIKPTQLSNATVEGEVDVLDSAWVLLKTRFRFPARHLPEYDFFEVTQHYSLVDNKARMITRQEFNYYSKSGKGKSSGNTVATFQQFELNKQFPKKYFTNEISATTEEAYKKDSSFWTQVRTEPLTEKEVRFIQYKDSVYRATHTKQYLDSVDKKTNKVTVAKVLFKGQVIYSREKERTWYLPTLASLYQPFQLGGARISPFAGYAKTFKSKKNIFVQANLSYGIRNKDINGRLTLGRLYNPFSYVFYGITVQRNFDNIFRGDAWINLLQRSNIYLNNSVGVNHRVELFNGFVLHNDFTFALRRSVSNYKTNDRIDSLFGDVLTNNQAIAFEPYNALYGKIRLDYTPRNKYIREPKQKINLGSKWPTFYTEWRKGIPNVLSSKVNFDYWEFGIEQRISFGLLGTSQYNVKSGTFFNTKDLRRIDYQFQRRGDPIFFGNPQEAFQALDSSFPVFKRFYQSHYLHEFNGALLSKIPFLNKLQLKEIAGAGFLIAPERNLRYVEISAGIERIFKIPFNVQGKFKLGVYVVGSAANTPGHNPVQFKIGITSWDIRNNKWQ